MTLLLGLGLGSVPPPPIQPQPLPSSEPTSPQDDAVEVSIWKYVDTQWALVGSATYERLEIEPRHQDVGVWSITVPYGSQAQAFAPDRLVTTTFRGDTRTWTINPKTVTESADDGVTVTVSGFDALQILGRATAWPNPNLAIGSQGAQGNYTGPAETVIRNLVIDNLRTRYGFDFVTETDRGRGTSVPSTPRFDNLLTEVLRVAQRGGIGVRFGLLPTSSSTRADLVLRFYVPLNKTTRVQLSAVDGSLATWELTDNEPTATKAIVGGTGTGAGQYLRVVTTADSITDATTWGGHREVFVDGPETFDNTALDQAGFDALAQGKATSALTMEADEPEGTKAFVAFTVGDVVSAAPLPDVVLPDVVSAIRVTHEDNSVEVTPIFGSPDAQDPDTMTAELIRSLRRDLQAMKTNRKRGAT